MINGKIIIFGPYCFWLQYLRLATNKESKRLSTASLVSISSNALMVATLHLHLLLVPPPPFLAAGQMNPSWPQYPEATAVLTDVLLPVQNFSGAQCELWRRNGFYNYAWIN